jgi:transposase
MVSDYRKKHNLKISHPTSKKSGSIESIEEENRRLRRENALLKKEKEILKKAAAYFAKETM